MDCEGQGAHQTNAIGIRMRLYVFHCLSIWHPFSYNLERIDRNSKAPEDVLMVQLHPQCDLPAEFLRNIVQRVAPERGVSLTL